MTTDNDKRRNRWRMVEDRADARMHRHDDIEVTHAHGLLETSATPHTHKAHVSYATPPIYLCATCDGRGALGHIDYPAKCPDCNGTGGRVVSTTEQPLEASDE